MLQGNDYLTIGVSMIKIGIMADIHNNLIALNSMLNVFEHEECEEIICCGDMIGIGPFPEETIKKIKSIKNLRCVLGNHEIYLLNGITWPYPDQMDEDEAQHHLWEHGELSEGSKEFIQQLPHKLFLEREGFKIAVLHYCLDENNQYTNYTKNPSPDDCDSMFSEINADIIVYGHNHITAVVNSKKRIYINCGSLGCPHVYEGIAKGGILTIDKGIIKFRPISAEYDLQTVINKIDEIEYPASNVIKSIFYGIHNKINE